MCVPSALKGTHTVLFCQPELANSQVRCEWMAILSAVARRHLLPLRIKITAKLGYDLLLSQNVIVTDMLLYVKFVSMCHNSLALGVTVCVIDLG